MKKILLLIAITTLIYSCTDEVTEPVADTPVVDAFLTPGKPAAVKLSKVIPFVDGGYSDSSYINDAEVYINFNGKDYQLTHTDGTTGKYIYTGDDLKILPENEYGLHFNYKGTTVSSHTVVPQKPDSLTISDRYYYVDQVSGQFMGNTDPLLVNWKNNDDSYYQIVVKYLDRYYNPINPYLDLNLYDSFRTISTSPLQIDTYSLYPRRNLAFYGNYRLILYKVNVEFLNLYNNTSQNTLTLTEPETNINNGVGIFTAVNADTVYFKVIKQ